MGKFWPEVIWLKPNQFGYGYRVPDGVNWLYENSELIIDHIIIISSSLSNFENLKSFKVC